jgi:hypothetical protein
VTSQAGSDKTTIAHAIEGAAIMNKTIASARALVAFALLLAPMRQAAAGEAAPSNQPTLPAAMTPSPENAQPADFDRLDTNGDGAIERGEVPVEHPLGTRFDELDANQDGKLSRDEFAKFG